MRNPPKLIDVFVFRLPTTLHPMTQLAIGVASMNHDSKFQAAYERGMKKPEYWSVMLEDCLSLIAKLPALAARIYRNVYNPGKPLPKINKDLDLVGMSAISCRCYGRGIDTEGQATM